MKTSFEWWQEVKADETLLIEWLKKQFHGERTAWDRMLAVLKMGVVPEGWVGVVEKIAEQEHQHSLFVERLLRERGVEALVLEKKSRYWEETLNGSFSFEELTAVATHAERMRLERIRVIAEDETAPTDIRTTFQRILRDEKFHAAAFEAMTSAEAVERAREAHNRGVQAIGLITQDMV